MNLDMSFYMKFDESWLTKLKEIPKEMARLEKEEFPEDEKKLGFALDAYDEESEFFVNNPKQILWGLRFDHIDYGDYELCCEKFEGIADLKKRWEEACDAYSLALSKGDEEGKDISDDMSSEVILEYEQKKNDEYSHIFNDVVVLIKEGLGWEDPQIVGEDSIDEDLFGASEYFLDDEIISVAHWELDDRIAFVKCAGLHGDGSFYIYIIIGVVNKI